MDDDDFEIDNNNYGLYSLNLDSTFKQNYEFSNGV
jgi:hypothetical protein